MVGSKLKPKEVAVSVSFAMSLALMLVNLWLSARTASFVSPINEPGLFVATHWQVVLVGLLSIAFLVCLYLLIFVDD